MGSRGIFLGSDLFSRFPPGAELARTCDLIGGCSRHAVIAMPQMGADFFTQMSMRLVGFGGLMSEEALQARLHRHGRWTGEITTWLDQRIVRYIGWGSQRWVPMFQFSDQGCEVRADVATVADELDGAFDDLEVLAWFVIPNDSLDRQTPIACMESRYAQVFEAARLDRFLASG